jgi:archaetidylinositol phosphate synthase
VIKARFGEDLDRAVHRVFPFLSRTRVSPDALTLVGMAVSFAAGIAFAQGEIRIGGLLLLLAGVFDLVDGVVARAQGTSSSAGAFLDSTADRVSDLAVFGGIACGMAARADVNGVALCMWALGASVMTSYARARAERQLARLEVGWMERGERCVVMILGAVSGFLVPALWIVALGATATTLQRVFVARRLLRELEATGRDPTANAGAAGAAGA